MPNKEVLQQITTFMLDIDGVLTDGSVIASENGDQLRVMNIKDAFALQLAIRKKYRICVISGGSAAGVQKRLENLGIKDIYMKIPHKLPVFHKYLLEHKLVRSEILYIGDDLPDYEIMQEVGVSADPADAADDILGIAAWVTQKPGGKGAVREIIETVMKVQGNWLSKEGFVW